MQHSHEDTRSYQATFYGMFLASRYEKLIDWELVEQGMGGCIFFVWCLSLERYKLGGILYTKIISLMSLI